MDSSDYVQGMSDTDRAVAENNPKGIFLISRLNYPIVIQYEGQGILVPPRCPRGFMRLRSLKNIKLPTGLFAVKE